MPEVQTYYQIATHAGEGKCYRYRLDIDVFPTGWEQPGYDDSAWAAPVLASTGSTTWPPADNPALVPPSQPWGDPLWSTATESDATAFMLYRFHIAVPDGALIRDATPTPGVFGGTFALESYFDPTFAFQSWVNGQGSAVGLTVGQFENLLVVGADNLIAILVPRSYTHSASLGLGRWASFLFQLAYRAPASGCYDEEDLVSGGGVTGIALQHSQHPYFAAPITLVGSGSFGALATGGLVQTDWGEAGPFFAADVATNSLDYDFAFSDYPLTLSSVELRAACTGAVDSSLSIEIGITLATDIGGDGSLQRSDGSDVFIGGAFTVFSVPDVVVRIPLSDLPLVSAVANGTLNADPIVPAISVPLSIPLTLVEPVVIWRRICLVNSTTGAFHASPTSNVVLGTQLGASAVYTFTSDVISVDASAVVGVWVEMVPSVDAVHPIMRNPYLRLCFNSGTLLTSTGHSSVQFVG